VVVDYFHLSGAPLRVGSIIEPGNYGRIVKRAAWNHGSAVRESALEAARLARFGDRPSRLDAVFVFPSREEAALFRSTENGFHFHHLYRVSLMDADAGTFITDWRYLVPTGMFRADWPDTYWGGLSVQTAIPPPFMSERPAGQCREVLTLASLKIEERFE